MISVLLPTGFVFSICLSKGHLAPELHYDNFLAEVPEINRILSRLQNDLSENTNRKKKISSTFARLLNSESFAQEILVFPALVLLHFPARAGHGAFTQVN